MVRSLSTLCALMLLLGTALQIRAADGVPVAEKPLPTFGGAANQDVSGTTSGRTAGGTYWVTNFGAEAGGGNFGVEHDQFIINGNTQNHFDGGWALVVQDSVHWAFDGCSVGGYPRRAGEWGPNLPCGINILSASYDNPCRGPGTDGVEEVLYSMIDLASTNGFFPPSIRQCGGVQLDVKQVGSQDPHFGDFVLTAVTITNEPGAPYDIPGDMNDVFFGGVTDWDIGAMSNNWLRAYRDGYAVYDGGYNPGNASWACGHLRLDAKVHGTGPLPSGSAASFGCADIQNDQGRGDRAFDMLSRPATYWLELEGIDVPTDICALYTLIHIPVLADGASESFYFAIYQIENGVNGLPWSTDDEFDAAVTEVFCRAKAFAGFGKGDVTCDGVIDLQDLVTLGNIIDSLIDPSGTGGCYTADVDADNDYDEDDYELLYDVVAGVQPASALANAWRF